MTCRAPTSATTCTGTQTGAQLSYDHQGQLTSWQNAPTSPSSTDAFLYDGEGNRVEQQSTTGLPGSPVTTTTAYIGNIEEVSSTGSTTTTTTYYYAGTQRIAVGVNGVLSYLMTDALGSATVALDSNGTVTAAQLYDPYGNGRYSVGAMPGSFGYTGQRSDALTGLNLDGARYYDPLASQFISADTILPGNGYDPWGLSRYAYVEGNPLIRTDPTGHDGGWLGGLVSAVTSTVSTVASAAAAAAPAIASVAWTALDVTTGIPSMIGDVQTIFSGNTSFLDKVMAVGDIALNVTMDVGMVVGVGEGMRAAYIGAKVAEHVAVDVGEHAIEHAGEDAVEHVAEHEIEDQAEHTAEDVAGGCLSFAAATLVATPKGETPIAQLKAGDHVTAYDPKTGKPSTQTVQTTSITHDTDLVDVTLRITQGEHMTTKAGTAQHAADAADATNATGTQDSTATPAPTAASATAASTTTRTEVVHTTANHPWLTADHGWLPASFMRLGESVQTLDGESATVMAIRVVPGAAAMWDLTISNLHDFAVGAGEYVVHNADICNFGNDHAPMRLNHIMDEHGEEEFQRLSRLAERGGRAGTEAQATLANRTFFREMGREEVERTVRQAWFTREKAGAIVRGANGEVRQLWRGRAGRMTIEGVYDWVGRTIHTAYPVF